MTDPGPVVMIGLKEIYDQLIRLNTKVEVMMGNQAEADSQLTDHEGRLRTLERSRWPLPTVGVLIALASLAVAVLVALNR